MSSLKPQRLLLKSILGSGSRSRLPQASRLAVKQPKPAFASFPFGAKTGIFSIPANILFSRNIVSKVASQRTFSTTTDKKEITTLTIDASDDIYKVVIPLPSAGRTVFPFKTGETVRDLVDDIRQEDAEINSVIFRYADGQRVAHTTSIDDLLKSEFLLEVNNSTFRIPVHDAVVGEGIPANVVGVNDLRALMQRAYFDRLRTRLQNDPRHHMAYSELISWCNEYGLSETDAQNFIRALHYSGQVLHFAENPELSQFIFLHPTKVFDTVKDSLNLLYLKQSDLAKLEELKMLKTQVISLDKVKHDLDVAAGRYSDFQMRIGFVAVAGLFYMMGRLVWVVFNWDIMEPLTYFVGLTTLIIGYTFFLFTRADYTYPALKERVANRRLRKLYLKHNFNWKKWDNYQSRITTLESELGIGKVDV